MNFGLVPEDIRKLIAEEILKNLRVEVSTERGDYYSRALTINVALMYGDECVSRSSTYESFPPA